MPYSTTRDGVRIYFEEHGEGTPFLLAQGLGGHAGMWESNRAALSSGHRLILWEPRGHARSDSPEDPQKVTFAHWVWDLQDLMDHLQLERAFVGGFSLGGGITTRFALAHPERVRALMLVGSSTASGLPMNVESLVMRAKSIPVTLDGGMDALGEYLIESNPIVKAQVERNPAAREPILASFRVHTPIGYANSVRALLQMDYITDRLSELKMPTLLACGDLDPAMPYMRAIEARIPHAQFKVLSPAGHHAYREQPEAFNQAVVTFLRSCE